MNKTEGGGGMWKSANRSSKNIQLLRSTFNTEILGHGSGRVDFWCIKVFSFIKKYTTTI